MATTKVTDAFEPEVVDRVRVLEQKRDSLRMEGYTALVDYEILKAQDLKDSDNISIQVAQGQFRTMKRGEYMLELQRKGKNCYAAARRLDEMLAVLPKAEAPPELRVEKAGS